jgi:DNA-binding NtrC family response regulator
LLFRKFSSDFAQKYKMPPIKLDDNAITLLQKYRWGGNIRQLRNIAEQISVLETNRNISLSVLGNYLPEQGSNLPAIVRDKKPESDFSNEREILYKVLFDMRADITDLRKLTMELMQNGNSTKVQESNKGLIQRIYGQENNHNGYEDMPRTEVYTPQVNRAEPIVEQHEEEDDDDAHYLYTEAVEESEILRLDEKEIELIKKALDRNKGKRKAAADELGISERTLYRKIKQFDL